MEIIKIVVHFHDMVNLIFYEIYFLYPLVISDNLVSFAYVQENTI